MTGDPPCLWSGVEVYFAAVTPGSAATMNTTAAQMKYLQLQQEGRIPKVNQTGRRVTAIKHGVGTGKRRTTMGHINATKFEEMKRIHMENAHNSWNSTAQNAHQNEDSASRRNDQRSSTVATLHEDNDHDDAQNGGSTNRNSPSQSQKSGSSTPSPASGSRKISEQRFMNLPKLKTERHEQHRRSNVLQSALDLEGDADEQMSEIQKLKKKNEEKNYNDESSEETRGGGEKRHRPHHGKSHLATAHSRSRLTN